MTCQELGWIGWLLDPSPFAGSTWQNLDPLIFTFIVVSTVTQSLLFVVAPWVFMMVWYRQKGTWPRRIIWMVCLLSAACGCLHILDLVIHLWPAYRLYCFLVMVFCLAGSAGVIRLVFYIRQLAMDYDRDELDRAMRRATFAETQERLMRLSAQKEAERLRQSLQEAMEQKEFRERVASVLDQLDRFSKEPS